MSEIPEVIDETFEPLPDKPRAEAAVQEVSPKDLLSFANKALLVIAILFALGGLSVFFLGCENPNATYIFDACKQILPPLATLILGSYFSSKN